MIQFLTALKAMVTTGSQPQTIPLAARMDACFASGLALALAGKSHLLHGALLSLLGNIMFTLHDSDFPASHV